MNICFIQPSDFLRTTNRTNPFFDPIVKCIDANWTIWLPRDENSGYAPEHVRHYGAIVFWSTWFWRAAHLLMPWVSAWKVYYCFGKLVRPFLRDWAKADVIITITGLFADILAGAFPDKRIVDIQHGVIYSKHDGYFNKDDSLVDPYRKFKNREFWLYGQGYADCFFKNSENRKWLDGRVKVIGDVLNAGLPIHYALPSLGKRKSLVCMLQFNNSYPMNELLKMKELWELYLEKNRETIEKQHLDVLIRHHPRFGNVVDFSDWAERFPWARVDTRAWNEVYDEALCCVGFNSTTIIEAAGRGIPVIILDGSAIGKDSYFAETFIQDEFKYPVGQMTLADWVASNEEKKQAIAKALQEWHRDYYAPFDQAACLKFLKGEASD